MEQNEREKQLHCRMPFAKRDLDSSERRRDDNTFGNIVAAVAQSRL